MVKDGWGDGFQEQNSYLLKSIDEKLNTINLNLKEIYENEYEPNIQNFIEKNQGRKEVDFIKFRYDELFEIDHEHIYTRLNLTDNTTRFFVNLVNEMAGGNINEFRKDEYFEKQYQDEIDGLKIMFDFICEFLAYQKQEKG
tara:strand:- start:219 stop:641 length:423 start_codon:yes stop_codon:yes gene_type:complete